MSSTVKVVHHKHVRPTPQVPEAGEKAEAEAEVEAEAEAEAEAAAEADVGRGGNPLPRLGPVKPDHSHDLQK